MGLVYLSVENGDEQGRRMGSGAQAWRGGPEPAESSPHRQEPELPGNCFCEAKRVDRSKEVLAWNRVLTGEEGNRNRRPKQAYKRANSKETELTE